jgi:hypothetical protein
MWQPMDCPARGQERRAAAFGAPSLTCKALGVFFQPVNSRTTGGIADACSRWRAPIAPQAVRYFSLPATCSRRRISNRIRTLLPPTDVVTSATPYGNPASYLVGN